jgi:antitoxin component YwqK of YwqJK toxin-antitoxin module
VKKIIFALALVFFIYGCDSNVTNFVQLRNNIAYLPNSNDPYTGKYEKNYDSGQKKSEINYKEGKIDGTSTIWYDNGQIKSETNYLDGKEDGLSTEWYVNGQKKYETNYHDGKQDGLFTEWYENGQKKSEANYKEGKKDGLLTRWHGNGQKAIEINYQDGIENGLSTKWDYPYGNGRTNGPLEKTEENYKDGKLAVRKSWYESGQIQSEINFTDEKFTKWYENGQKKLEKIYKDSITLSETTWDENGRVTYSHQNLPAKEANLSATTEALPTPDIAEAQTETAKESDLPLFKENESYSSIRTKMIDSGWTPFHSENADTCSEGDSRCEGRPEMEICAGTGMANCKFLWKKNEKTTAICTVGEEALFEGICN